MTEKEEIGFKGNLDKKEDKMEKDPSEEDDHRDHHNVWKISLRPFEISDIDDFLSWAQDSKIYRFVNNEPTLSREQGMELLKCKMDQPWCKSICIDQKSIGELSLKWSEANKHRAEIGYVLGSVYWGRGYATQAVNLASRSIFCELPHLERLEAIVDVDNLASQRVLEKAGFSKEGVFRKYYKLRGNPRDMVMYSFLSSDLNANHEL